MGYKKLKKLKKIIFYAERSEESVSSRPLRKEVMQTPVLMALMKSPGPARYLLPSCTGYIGHDITMPKAPAYTFHLGHSENWISDSCSPGPCHYYDPKVTHCGVSTSSQIPMEERIANLRVWSTPAPSEYFWEKVPPLGERRAPQYSIGYRCPYRVSDSNPAPNEYTQPPRLGYGTPVNHSAPSYSFASTSDPWYFNKDIHKNPGPAMYNQPDPSVCKHRSPLYSMGKRFGFPRDRTHYPSPGSHEVQSVTVHKRQAPSFSMGIKHSPHLTPLIEDIKD